MAIEVNSIVTEKDERFTNTPLMVTIALEEYRDLVRENAKLEERVLYLEKRLLDESYKRGVDYA